MLLLLSWHRPASATDGASISRPQSLFPGLLGEFILFSSLLLLSTNIHFKFSRRWRSPRRAITSRSSDSPMKCYASSWRKPLSQCRRTTIRITWRFLTTAILSLWSWSAPGSMRLLPKPFILAYAYTPMNIGMMVATTGFLLPHESYVCMRHCEKTYNFAVIVLVSY